MGTRIDRDTTRGHNSWNPVRQWPVGWPNDPSRAPSTAPSPCVTASASTATSAPSSTPRTVPHPPNCHSTTVREPPAPGRAHDTVWNTTRSLQLPPTRTLATLAACALLAAGYLSPTLSDEDRAALAQLEKRLEQRAAYLEVDVSPDTQFVVLPAPDRYRIDATSADTPLDPERYVEELPRRLWHAPVAEIDQVAVTLHTADGLRYDTAAAPDVHPAGSDVLEAAYGPRPSRPADPAAAAAVTPAV